MGVKVTGKDSQHSTIFMEKRVNKTELEPVRNWSAKSVSTTEPYAIPLIPTKARIISIFQDVYDPAKEVNYESTERSAKAAGEGGGAWGD